MSFQPIQIILIPFVLFAISRVFLRAREGKLSLSEFVFWASIFATGAIGIYDPGFTNYVALALGIGRGVDVVIYTSIMLLFYLIFRLTIALENIRHEITKLVREMTLMEDRLTKHPTKK